MPTQPTITEFIYRHLYPRAGLLLVRLLSRTYRYQLVDAQHEQQVLQTHGSAVYAAWHQRFFPCITFFDSRQPMAIMISRSRDGEMAARVADTLGYRPVRGSSSRGGVGALKTLRSLTRQGFRIGHIVDGPQGPFGVVKPGLITISQFSGAPIVPVITSAQRRWTVNSWDRFMIPKPFSRVIIRFAPPTVVPRRLEPEGFEALRQGVEKQIKDLTTQTDNWWRSPEIIAGYFD
jgi:lysophospholipid acyltransferase (LPLAT)-like uncharacterized protein